MGFGVPLGTNHPKHDRRTLEAAVYYSPEQAGVIDQAIVPSSDLYSLGMILRACLTGALTTADELSEILYTKVAKKVESLRDLGVELPLGLDHIIQRMVKRSPRDRYQSADAAIVDMTTLAVALQQGNNDPHIVVGLCDRRDTLIDPAFVSRDAELAQLEKCLGQSVTRQSGIVSLVADSGLGKTSLLNEFAARARNCGFWILRGQGFSDSGLQPMAALEPVISECVAAATVDKSFRDQLESLLEDYRSEITAAAPQLAAVFGWRAEGVSQLAN